MRVPRQAITPRQKYGDSMNSNYEPRPWLDHTGKIYPDNRLREISQAWTPETWELFLKETVEGSQSYQREDLISAKSYDLALEEHTASIWASDDSGINDNDFTKLRRLIRDHLSPRQQHTIRLVYWDGLAERKIAELLGVSRSMVAINKRRSLIKLEHLIEKRIPSLLPYDETSKLPTTQPTSRLSDLQEVYREETSDSNFGKFR